MQKKIIFGKITKIEKKYYRQERKNKVKRKKRYRKEHVDIV